MNNAKCHAALVSTSSKIKMLPNPGSGSGDNMGFFNSLLNFDIFNLQCATAWDTISPVE